MPRKQGTINAAYDFQGNRCNNTFKPYNVDVTWNDGTTEQVSYLSVRQLDPVLNKPMECRAQWTLFLWTVSEFQEATTIS